MYFLLKKLLKLVAHGKKIAVIKINIDVIP